jgi:hypothetical protein
MAGLLPYHEGTKIIKSHEEDRMKEDRSQKSEDRMKRESGPLFPCAIPFFLLRMRSAFFPSVFCLLTSVFVALGVFLGFVVNS